MKKLIALMVLLTVVAMSACAEEWQTEDFLLQYLPETTWAEDITQEEIDGYTLHPNAVCDVAGVRFTVDEFLFDGLSANIVISGVPMNDDKWLMSDFGWEPDYIVPIDGEYTMTIAQLAEGKELTAVGAYVSGDDFNEFDQRGCSYSEHFFADGHIQLFIDFEFMNYVPDGYDLPIMLTVGEETGNMVLDLKNNVPMTEYGYEASDGITVKAISTRLQTVYFAVFPYSCVENGDDAEWGEVFPSLNDAETGNNIDGFGCAGCFLDSDGNISSEKLPDGKEMYIIPTKYAPDRISITLGDPFEDIEYGSWEASMIK